MAVKKPSLEGLDRWRRVQIRRLFIDIETSPNVVYSWRIGSKINLAYDKIVQERAVICIGFKWQGGKSTKCLAWDNGDDKAMLEQFIPIMESATEVVAHWGDRFDMPWLRARAAIHGIPVSPYIKTIDTCAQSRRLFYFNSHKLDYLGQLLKVGKKVETDYELWQRVMSGSKQALQEMMKYCKGDVELLEKVYLRMESYNRPKTHYGAAAGRARSSCPRCGCEETKRIGKRVSGMGTPNPLMRCDGCRFEFLITAAEARRVGL